MDYSELCRHIVYIDPYVTRRYCSHHRNYVRYIILCYRGMLMGATSVMYAT